MNHQSTITVKSTVAPEVAYVFYRPNAVRRASLVMATFVSTERLHAVIRQARELMALPAGNRDPDALSKTVAAAHAVGTGIDADHLRILLKGVTGLTLDGKPADVEGFILNGPSDLFQECVLQAQNIMKTDEQTQAPAEPQSPMAVVVN